MRCCSNVQQADPDSHTTCSRLHLYKPLWSIRLIHFCFTTREHTILILKWKAGGCWWKRLGTAGWPITASWKVCDTVRIYTSLRLAGGCLRLAGGCLRLTAVWGSLQSEAHCSLRLTPVWGSLQSEPHSSPRPSKSGNSVTSTIDVRINTDLSKLSSALTLPCLSSAQLSSALVGLYHL